MSVERETVAKRTSLGCWSTVLLPDPHCPRARMHHEHDATRRIPAHLAKGYSTEGVGGKCSEVGSGQHVQQSYRTELHQHQPANYVQQEGDRALRPTHPQ